MTGENFVAIGQGKKPILRRLKKYRYGLWKPVSKHLKCPTQKDVIVLLELNLWHFMISVVKSLFFKTRLYFDTWGTFLARWSENYKLTWAYPRYWHIITGITWGKVVIIVCSYEVTAQCWSSCPTGMRIKWFPTWESGNEPIPTKCGNRNGARGLESSPTSPRYTT